MVALNVPAEGLQTRDPDEVSAYLARYGIWYRRFEGTDDLGPEPTDAEVLAAYDAPIQALMKEGGYKTADVIDVGPQTPNLEAMLDKFNKEHWHSENEVRFIVAGRGIFHLNPGERGPVFSLTVEPGDMINVPRGTHHWFDLCDERRIRAIRLFEDTSGWTPHYTGSGVDAGHQPLCLGPQYVPAR